MKPEILKFEYMKNFLSIITIITFFVGFTVLSISCKKDDPPKAIVKVVDEAGNPVDEAIVVIKSPNREDTNTAVYFKDRTAMIADTSHTNSEGIVNYEFKYEAIYKVEVIKADRKTTKRGIGSLRLLNNKTVEERIRINENIKFD